MSAETIPAEMVDILRGEIGAAMDVTEDGTAMSDPNFEPAVEDVVQAVIRVLTDRSTRPAEPAAPVAEAGDGDGDVAASLAHLNIGYLYGIADALEHTDFTRAGDIRQCLLQVVKGLSASAATLEAERARADRLEQERDWQYEENVARIAAQGAAEQRAADALARAEKAEGALAEAQGALVDLADWLENDCGAELPHSHIEKQVAIARGAPPRTERAERGLNVDATMALIEGALKWAVWCVGEGIMAIESEGVAAPEDFLITYSDATGEEDWETLHERLPALLRASREAQPATDGGDNG